MNPVPYVLCGVKYIDLVSLAPFYRLRGNIVYLLESVKTQFKTQRDEHTYRAAEGTLGLNMRTNELEFSCPVRLNPNKVLVHHTLPILPLV